MKTLIEWGKVVVEISILIFFLWCIISIMRASKKATIRDIKFYLNTEYQNRVFIYQDKVRI